MVFESFQKTHFVNRNVEFLAPTNGNPGVQVVKFRRAQRNLLVLILVLPGTLQLRQLLLESAQLFLYLLTIGLKT